MVDLADAGSVPSAEAAPVSHDIESDFSPRKIKIATAVLIGQTFATSILPYSAFSLLMIPMTHAFGWSRTEFSFASTFIFIFGAASLWPIGRLTDKVGVRPVILFGTTIVGLITLAMALQTKSLPQLYFYYAMLGIFGSTGVAYSKVVASLFTQHRGKALAILGAESTVAMAIIPLITNALLLNFGWRTMFVVFGITILAVVPILFFTLEEPGERGIKSRFINGAKSGKPTHDASQRHVILEGITVKEALKDRVFWMIVAAGLAAMLILTGMFAHMVPALMGKGFTQTQAVAIISASQLIGIMGSLAGGFLVDYYHTAKVAIPFNLLSAVGAIVLLAVTASFGGIPLLFVALALGGFAFGAARPMSTYFHTRFFGLKAFTEISSVQFMITNPVTAFAAPLIGLIFDTTHSYNLAFILMAAAPLFSAAIYLFLPKYRYSANIGQMKKPTAVTSG